MTSHRESARVTTYVAVTPDDAFEVFTQEIDLWWRRGPRFRGRGESELCFEQDARGRRLVERFEGEEFEIGRVRVWEPGRRLVFEWRGRNFAPGEVTEVEVRFAAVSTGTQVTLEHRGWDAIRDDHPARHGRTGSAFARSMGLHWGELMSAYRGHVSPRGGSA